MSRQISSGISFKNKSIPRTRKQRPYSTTPEATETAEDTEKVEANKKTLRAWTMLCLVDKVFKVSKCMNNHNFRDIPNINVREKPDKMITREGCHN